MVPRYPYVILKTRNRYLQEAGPTSGFVVLPSPSSAVSVCPPWCTPAANLPEFQTSLVPPVTNGSPIRSCHTF